MRLLGHIRRLIRLVARALWRALVWAVGSPRARLARIVRAVRNPRRPARVAWAWLIRLPARGRTFARIAVSFPRRAAIEVIQAFLHPRRCASWLWARLVRAAVWLWRICRLAWRGVRFLVGSPRERAAWVVAAVPVARTFAAPQWHKLVRSSIVILGLAGYAGLQFGLAQMITNWWWYYLILVGVVLAGAAVLFRSPFIAYVGWLALSPWAAYLLGADVGGAFVLTFDRVALPALAMLLVFRLLKDRTPIRRPTTAELLLLLYLVYITLYSAFTESTGIKSYLVLIWEALVSVGAAYWIVKGCVAKEEHVRLFLKAIVLIGIVWAITGIWEHFTGSMWLSALVGRRIELAQLDVAKGRARGPADHLYAYGAVLILSLFVSYHLAGWARSAHARLFYYLVAAASALALFYSYARAAYIGAFVCWLVVFLLAGGRRARYGAFLGVLAVVVIALAPTMWAQKDFRERLLNVGSAESRMPMNRTALNMALHNLYFGVGQGHLLERLPEYITELGYARGAVRGHRESGYLYPHNDYLIVLAERGAVGFLLFYGSIVGLTVHLYRLRRWVPRSGELGKELVDVMLGFVVACLFMTACSEVIAKLYPYLYFLLFAIFGLLVRYSDLVEARRAEGAQSEAPERADPAWAGRPAPGIAGVSGVGI